MFNNFSKESQEVIKIARSLAEQYGHSYISSKHFFLGLLQQKNSFAYEVLEYMGFDILDIINEIEKTFQYETSSKNKEEILFTPIIKTILENAETIMKSHKLNIIDTIHILLGILKTNDSEITQMLKETGITYKEVKSTLDNIFSDSNEHIDMFNDIVNNVAHSMENALNSPVSINNNIHSKKSQTPALDKFGKNLTNLAKEGKLDPVIGRDKEFKRIWQILARRKKNNCVLIGESGCGKTAIADGLANCIANGKVSVKLKHKQIIQLDVSEMIAGSKYRGDFEKKLKNIIQECVKQKNIILFIDELHTIIGSGNSEGSMDGANILKPYLSSGEIQIIGSTTTDEYQKYFEKDSALVRRFQKLFLESPDKENTIKILNGIKKYYENYHNVSYSNDIINLIVDLSDKYISSQSEPDKSINTLDEVGSKLSLLESKTIPNTVIDAFNKYNKLINQEQILLFKKDNKKAIKVNIEAKKSLKEFEILNTKYLKNITKEVTEKDVREVFSLISNIPVESIQNNSNDAKRYLSMAKELKKKIINQNEAIDVITKTIKRKKAGVENINKPSVLLFAGATGTGKTFTTKKLAEFLFHDEKKMLFLNGAEYADKTALNRLTSSNPGYVGYGEATDFEYIRNNPYSILLIDECEKMHPDIWQIFLRIFEEGELTTSNGKLINFKNCIIILTSNLGSKNVQKNNVGFNLKDELSKKENKKIKYETAIKEYFKPEVLNRISNIVIFNDLSKTHLKNIAKLELTYLQQTLKEKDIKLIVKPSVYNFIINNTDDTDENMGARPIKRSIENNLNDEISDIILEKGDTIKTITINVIKNKLSFISK